MIRCARSEQSGELEARLELALSKTTRQELDRIAFELKQQAGLAYSAGDVARHLIETGLQSLTEN